MKPTGLETLNALGEQGRKRVRPKKPRIAVGMGTCGIGNGARDVFNGLQTALKKQKINALITPAGCFGFCAAEPLVNVVLPGRPLVIFKRAGAKTIPAILRYIRRGILPENQVLCKIESWDHLTGEINFGAGLPRVPSWHDVPFFKLQKKIVLRNCGLIDPENIAEYAAVGGYRAAHAALTGHEPEKIIAELKKSKLRGRGGAGFPAGLKWEIMKNMHAPKKYVICNADEGDPGAYMNRNEIESDPHSLIEGMIIGGFAMGAREGIVYVRAEYPLAVQRLRQAVKAAENHGFLGRNIFNSGFDFSLSLVEGAGAFVCGEETALIASLEGFAGKPRPRPPFPAQAGLWGYPTNINNVETWFNIPVIISRGGEWFARAGTENSAGTKVFSLVGKVKNTGLVELPLGTPLENIVLDTGEGSSGAGKIKAVQTGGPSGGCIPRKLFGTPVDYESLAGLGAIMGSGGMVVMDEDNCMVDAAKYFLEFTTAESCGKCVPCREGLYQALQMLKLISEGRGTPGHLAELEKLGMIIKDSALCGLGQTGPNPVLTTLRYFKEEYEEHIIEKRCSAGICEALFPAPCENSCPLHMNIPGFIQLFKEGRLEDAFLCVIQDNPLPAVTGRACHHPCEQRCRRKDIDEPISKREIHRYIADAVYRAGKDIRIFNALRAGKLPAAGKKIAVIGSGPAGLTAAFYLARLGHNVFVYEREKSAGGMLRLTIPRYRLPKEILEREINNIRGLGVTFKLKTNVGTDISLKALEQKHDAVFIAVGASEEITLGIPGEQLNGVYHGIEFLEHTERYKRMVKGKKVIVVGGGNAAFDVSRTAVRFGAQATIVYRRDKADMPALAEEIEDARAEGVRFMFLSLPEKILDDGRGNVKAVEIRRMVLSGYDQSGRRKPVPAPETFSAACDIVILAIAVGERVDVGFLRNHGIDLRKNNTIIVDRWTLQTRVVDVFAGGDAVSGPSTITQAMAAGKKAARIIDGRLTGEDRFAGIFTKHSYGNTAPVEPQGGKRNKIPRISRQARKGSFREVCLTFAGKQAEREAVRCLRCDVKK